MKKDLAQYEATFKMDKAKWGADLEDQKYEVREREERGTWQQQRHGGARGAGYQYAC